MSVVVNNFDYADYLAEAIDSALGQSGPDVETIVVDDGSTDDSRRIIAGYGSRIGVVLQRNRGQTAACAAGLEASSGDVVIFLDSDDVLLPGAASAAVCAFERCPGAVRVSWPLWEVGRSGERTGGMRPPVPLDRGDLRRRVSEQGPDSYISAPTSGNAWTRRFLREVLPADEEENLRLGADAYLAVLSPLFGLIEVIEEPHGLYRVHGRNGYWQPAFEHRAASLLHRYGPRVRALVAIQRRLGIAADERDIISPYYAWLRRMYSALESVRRGVPAGVPFLLVDNGEWDGRLFADRTQIPFTERANAFWGPPADDADAVAELRRQIENGVQHVVVGWPAFWYLECYPGLLDQLELLSATDDVHVYRVRAEAPPTAST